MSFLFSVRSPQWLRSKWWALKKHVPESDATTFQGMFSLLPLSPWLVLNEYFLVAFSQWSGRSLLMQPVNMPQKLAVFKGWPY